MTKHLFLQILLVCTVVEAIQTIRPGAQWSLSGTGYDGLTWLDANQTKPTRAEIIAALTDCNNAEASRAAKKALARFTVKLSTATAAQKANALILLLDLDK